MRRRASRPWEDSVRWSGVGEGRGARGYREGYRAAVGELPRRAQAVVPERCGGFGGGRGAIGSPELEVRGRAAVTGLAGVSARGSLGRAGRIASPHYSTTFPPRFSLMVQDKPLRTSWERKLKERQEKKLVRDLVQQLQEAKQREREVTGCCVWELGQLLLHHPALWGSSHLPHGAVPHLCLHPSLVGCCPAVSTKLPTAR